MKLWENCEEINLLCAVAQQFGIDQKYNPELLDLMRRGLIVRRWYWELTADGQKVVDTQYPPKVQDE